MRATVYRRLRQAVLGIAVFMTLVCAGMVASAAVDDAAIAKDRKTATAEVIDVGVLRTSVRFRDEEGTYHQPNVGLKYPTGLVKGQNVRVDYSAEDPSNVKVQGRNWTLAFRPALSTWLLAMTVCVGLYWLVSRRQRAATGRVTFR